MIKKILVVLAVLFAAFFIAAGILSRKAPALLQTALRNAIGKKVVVGSLQYHFPWRFELQGLRVLEEAPFAGESAFYVEELVLEVSPMGFLGGELTIQRITAKGAEIVVRRYRGRLIHALSKKTQSGEAGLVRAEGSASPGGRAGPRLHIGEFRLTGGRVQFIDYDVQQEGFVVLLEEMEAVVGNLTLPSTGKPTSYSLRARIAQGRDGPPADVLMNGWTEFETLNTETRLETRGLRLPYFRPYYGRVTPAFIEGGRLDSQARIAIQEKRLRADADLVITELLFGSYELGGELFGLQADRILSFLKDSSGRLQFQIAVEWDLNDRSVKPAEVIRKSIEKSLQRTVLGNVQNILANTIAQIGQKGTGEAKDDLEAQLEKIKQLFKY